jgi:hypothetical protein
MGLFKPDLYRNMALGFMLGAVLAGWQIAPQLAAEIAPPAHAATIDAPAR